MAEMNSRPPPMEKTVSRPAAPASTKGSMNLPAPLRKVTREKNLRAMPVSRANATPSAAQTTEARSTNR